MKSTLMLALNLVALTVTAFGQDAPPPYVVLALGQGVNGQRQIEIPEGYLVEIVSLDLVTGKNQPGTPGNAQTFSRLDIHAHGGESPYSFDICYTSEAIPAAFPKFMGPSFIEINVEGGQNERGVVGLKITALKDTSVVPSSSVVIPADATGPVAIILESSKDMVTWTEANPGSYGASTPGRFFRVRAVAGNN